MPEDFNKYSFFINSIRYSILIDLAGFIIAA